MKLLRTLLLLSLVAMSGPSAAAANISVGDVTFSKTVMVTDTPLNLRGAAVLTYLSFIKAYAGALYLPAAAGDWDAPDVPRRLELSYYRAIKAEDFDRATRKKMADNVDAAGYAALKARLDQFCALYRDVSPGDRYALNYVPGRGTELALNGSALGVIEGADFAAAVFAIWLGSDPIDADFRNALLGRS